MPVKSLRKDLLQLGETIKSAPRVAATIKPLIDNYITLFDRWFTEEGPKTSQETPTDKLREELEAVQRVHTAVMGVVGEMKASMSQSLVGLHQKERAMLAYIDTLPKRVSVGKARKG